jgi:hypothetical protein
MGLLPWVALIGLLVVLGILAWPKVVCPLMRESAWRGLAARTGLAYRRRKLLGIPRPGRIVGTYRGRECTLYTHKELGIELRMCIVLSVDNQAEGAMSVLWRQHLDQSFLIRRSQPKQLVDELFASDSLGQRLEDVAQRTWSHSYHVELSGHLLKFEQKPQTFCPGGGARQYADRLQALLDVLCDVADAIEQMPKQPVPYKSKSLAAW